ncbi:MAG: armadillo-type protein [Piptocephalis tieghemiana]|nr:MAG: armadillo-type protein [Piptocephalis tieghemiana]
MATLTSAGGVISLLDEDEQELQVYALQQLNTMVSLFWSEISNVIAKIEILYEDTDFPSRPLAALVASKVYYYLGAYEESLTYALHAGDLFNPSVSSDPYVETLVARAIDEYTSQRKAAYSAKSAAPESSKNAGALEVKDEDPRLRGIVERMFDRCLASGEYSQAIGIALESRRLDIIEKSIQQSGDPAILEYVLDVAMKLLSDLRFRNEVLTLLVHLLRSLPSPDYITSATCYVHLGEPKSCADMLSSILNQDIPNGPAIAYQVAFDVEATASQQFRRQVLHHLPPLSPDDAIHEQQVEEEKEGEDKDMGDTTEEKRKQASNQTTSPLGHVREILKGDRTVQLYLEFLYRNNHANLQILKTTKDSGAPTNSAFHTAVTFSNGIMHAGTTSDRFLRLNLEWLGRAKNWAQFSATASLGVIHKGHLHQSMALLKPYLPSEQQESSEGGTTAPNAGASSSPSSSSSHSEGGSLYALGMIHANQGTPKILQYLREIINSRDDSVIRHGACLGLGLAGLSSHDEEAFEDLRSVMYGDGAVEGEGAALGMGLIMLGYGDQGDVVRDMLEYAHETQHEKIIRALGLSLALTQYGREGLADPLIQELQEDKDPLLRYGAMHMVGLAYCGTGNNSAIRLLLHVAVSDVNDDVRRAAVTSLGFILFRRPEQVPRMVQLLSESYNAHVRYGATLALGIACAGTGLEAAVDLLEPMTKDPVDYVRQGALISLALILIQHTDHTSPKATAIRRLFQERIADKHEYLLAKFGAVLAQGIIDAGGRNCTISLGGAHGGAGHLDAGAVVGLMMFTQLWSWFPLTHFLSLALTPTAIIGLTQDLTVPDFTFTSACKPSTFAYPAAIKPPQESRVEKVATAVLSTTARAKARAKRAAASGSKGKEGEESEGAGTTGGEEAMGGGSTTTSTSTEKDGEDNKGKESSEPEPETEEVGNMRRVMPGQVQYLHFPKDARYTPIRQRIQLGVTLLEDHRPEEEKSRISTQMPKVVAMATPSSATSAGRGGRGAGAGPTSLAEAMGAGGHASGPAGLLRPGLLGRGGTDEEDPEAEEEDTSLPEPFEYPFEHEDEEEQDQEGEQEDQHHQDRMNDN